MADKKQGYRPAQEDDGQSWDKPIRPISRSADEVRTPHVPKSGVRHSQDRFSRPPVNGAYHKADRRGPATPTVEREYRSRPTPRNQRSAEEEWRQQQLEGIQALLALSVPVTANPAITVPLFIGTKQPDRPRSILKDPALRGAIALMLSAGVAGGLGFVFWAFTAHRLNASAVGAISAEVSSITFLAGVGSLNLISIFGRFLPEAGSRARKLVATGYGSASLAGLLISTIFLFTPLANDLVIGGAAGRLAFVLCVILNSVFNIQDGGLIGFGRFGWIPVENASVALLRFLLLPVTAIFLAARVGVLWAWALPMVIAVAVVSTFNLGPLAGQKMRQLPNLPKIGELSKLVAVGSLSNSVNAAVTAFLPALVTHRLGSVQGGYFYIPWTITTMVILLLNNVTTSMVREVVANPKRAGQAIRRSVMLAALVGVVIMVACLGFAHLILAPLGPGFAEHGAPLLRWAGLAMPAAAGIVLFWAVCSIRRRPLPSFVVNLLTATAVVGGVLLLKPGTDISRVGMIYCTVQWAAAAVLAVPTFTALRSIARDWESRRQS